MAIETQRMMETQRVNEISRNPEGQRPWWRWLVVGVLTCAACGVTDDAALPPDVQDPASVRTPAGAIGMYRSVITGGIADLLEQFVYRVGVLTDELAATPLPVGLAAPYTPIDARLGGDWGGGGSFAGFHKFRARAGEARGLLNAYAPDSSRALRGHLYTVEAYADVFLADLYCSGIPLSTVDFGADYTLAAGSTTQEVYTKALALLDSAFALTNDSVSLQHFAAVGRGRVLLALGRYADAAVAVAAVPDAFRYQVVPVASNTRYLFLLTSLPQVERIGSPGMADREGVNGLDFRSSGDPRTLARLLGKDKDGNDIYGPAKYHPVASAFTYTMASGVEARLIEAEAALQAGSADWLTKLNALRTDGTFDTVPKASDPTQNDTLWHAGSGGVAKLRPLGDPGASLSDPIAAKAARVDVVFRERGFWLYLTGIRQGDLRRLVREYGRVPNTVYPTGTYRGAGGAYGDAIVTLVPKEERELNPKYTGCIHLDA